MSWKIKAKDYVKIWFQRDRDVWGKVWREMEIMYSDIKWRGQDLNLANPGAEQ